MDIEGSTKKEQSPFDAVEDRLRTTVETSYTIREKAISRIGALLGIEEDPSSEAKETENNFQGRMNDLIQDLKINLSKIEEQISRL